MDATEALYMLRQIGLTLTAAEGRLVVQPAELLDDEVRWLIRKHRDALVELIQVEPPKGIETEEAHFHWRVRFSSFALDTFHHPYATHAEVLRKYPEALAAEPLPEPPRREWTTQEEEDWQAAWCAYPDSHAVACGHRNRQGPTQ